MTDQRQPQLGRFHIRRNSALRPLITPFGGSAARSFVEIDGDHLRARFGWLFDYTFPLDQIEYAEPSHRPWYLGLGWRTSLRGRIGLIDSYKNVVEIRFRTRYRVNMVFPKLACERLAISLEAPEAFLAALSLARR